VEQLVDSSRAVIEKGSKSFAAAARLFAPETRAGAYMLYAWCRHCDDETDDQKLGFSSSRLSRDEGRARVDRLRRETRRALDGEPVEEPVFQGLQQVVARHQIPHRFPLEHLDGFVMDVEGREYKTLDDTLEYCYHVAGVVGIMMAYVMGVRDEPTLDRATDLGLAFQLTNICRDVVEDARVGRVYLPSDWLADAGIGVKGVAEPENRDGVFQVARRVLAEADRYYDSARLGISQLPLRSAWAVAAANAVYRDIGRLILKRGSRAWDRRASTGRGRKIALVLGSGVGALTATVVGRGPGSRPRSGLWVRPKTT
jgi:phytoene synthase